MHRPAKSASACKVARSMDVFRRCIEEGITECSQLAEEMKVTKGTISKWAKKAEREGWLKTGKREYQLVDGTTFRVMDGGASGNEDTVKIDPSRFHIQSRSFPVRFHASRGKRAPRFLSVSRSFPFVSCFHAYMQETGNELDLLRMNRPVRDRSRPRELTEAQCDELLQRITDGDSLSSIVEGEGWPLLSRGLSFRELHMMRRVSTLV